MAKNPVFYALATLILWSASLVVPSAHAAVSKGNCLTGNKYFHLECSGTSSNRDCKLSQVETSTPKDNVEYACWLDVSDKLEESDNKSSQIILESDLDLGGYDDSENRCALTFIPIASGHSFDGQGKTIKGFCYSANNAGFFETLSGKEFKNVTFEDPYVIGMYAGVVASTIQDAAIVSNVTIQNASLFGTQLGGVAGVIKKVNNENEISINKVSISGISLKQDRTYLSQAITFYMGSVAGVVDNTKVSVSNVNVDNISVPFSDFESSYIRLGGFLGELYTATASISNSTITTSTGLNLEGSGKIYVGGVVGENYVSHLTVSKVGFNGNLSGQYVGGIIGYLSDDNNQNTNTIVKNTYTKGDIKGTTSAGYIIGYLKAVTSLDQNDSLYNNIHFGSDAVSEGVGNYAGSNTWGYSWAQGTLGKEYVADQGNIFGNVRNASSGLTANETFGFHFNVLNDSYNNVLKTYMDFFEGTYNPSSSAMWPMIRVANGIAKDADMESGLLAALLNFNLEMKGQDAIWISDGGLPTFAKRTDEPNHLVLLETSNLHLTQAQENALTIKNQSIRDSSESNNSGTNPPDLPVSVKRGVVSYTDASGYLNSDFWDNVNKLIADGKDNLGVSVLLEDGSGNAVSQTKNFDSHQMMRFSMPSMFFCFKDNGSELVFHQAVTTTPDDETCFDSWFHDDGSGNDAYTYAQDWLDNTISGSIVLTGDVVFAGTTNDNNGNTVCADEPNAFKGKYLELGSGDTLKSEDGNRHTVFGLCYVSSTMSKRIGFVKTNAATSRIENIAFSNVLFKLTGDNSKAGIALFNVSPDSVDGISVSNSKFNADSVGAIAGSATNVKKISNISLSGVKLDGKVVGSVFGYVSAANDVSISNIAVEGSSDGLVNCVGGYAGGLVGRFNNSTSVSKKLTIKNTYTKGDIKSTNENTIGYLIGNLEPNDRFTYDITDNYHYGTNDDLADEGIIGVNWNDHPTNDIARNFRNSITSGPNTLDATGSLQYAEKPVVGSVIQRAVMGRPEYYNGIIPAVQMKSARFAAVLNMGGTANWTIDAGSSPKNDGLPFLVDGSNKPIYAISFDLANFDLLADANAMQNLEDALYYKTYSLESIDANGTQGIILYTNSAGKLSTDDVNFVNSLLTDFATDSWEGSKVLSAAQTYTENMTYTYTSTRKVKYFCFNEYSNNLYLSQREYDTPPSTESCYAYWYDYGADPFNSATQEDAYSYAQKWLDDHPNGGNIYLSTDITFAGRSGESCNEAPNAFKGKYLELGNSQGLYSQPSERHIIHTISGLCYTSSWTNEMGFVKIMNSNAGIGDITFSDVFFKLTNASSNDGSAGVIMLHADLELLGGIRVNNSVFQAYNAGAILGSSGDYQVKRLENITLFKDTITSYNYGGVAAGYIKGLSVVKGISETDGKASIFRENGTVSVGGFFGGVVGYVSNASYVNSTSVSDVSVYGLNMDAINSSQLGGVFGHLDAVGEVSFQGISVNGEVLGSQVGGLVGELWYNADVAVSITKTKITGHLWTAYDSNNDVLGGLIGMFDTRVTNAVGELKINHNFINGTLESQKSSLCGYLVGSSMDNAKYNVTDNYYYTSSDVSAKVGITGITDWENPSLASGSIITRNFRNAVDGSLEKDGDLHYATKPIQMYNFLRGTTTEYNNGVIPGEQMKSARFAAVLNTDKANWTIDEGDSPFNNGLPYFAEGSKNPIYAVSFDLNNFNELTADETHRDIFNEAISQNRYSLETVNGTNRGIVLFSNKSGMLTDNDHGFINSLLDKDASWVGSPAWSKDNDIVYQANTIYTYNASILMNIVNYFCTANDGNEGCKENTDNVLSGNSGLDVSGYSIGYLLPPVNTYRAGQENSLISPLMVSDNNSVKSYLPATYKIKSRVANQEPITGNLWGMASDYSALLPVIQSLDFSTYENTIHLYYVNGVGASTNIKIANEGTLDYVIKGFAFDADGALKKQIYDKSIPAGSYVDLPVTPVIMLEKAPFGFNLDWSLEFGYETATNTNLVDNSYLVENSNVFAMNYTTDSWKIENRSETDQIHLDSIYNGLIKAFALDQTLSQEDFKITITPTLTPSNYSVTFDLGDKYHKDTLLVFTDRAYSQWDAGKIENVGMEAGERFSRVYIYTKENATFQSLLWNYDNQSTSEYSELSSTLLKNATGGDASITDLTLYPIRGSSITSPGLINVFAYDGDGNLLTNADDYHGSIILLQKIGSTEFKQESHFESDVKYNGKNYMNSDGLNVPNSPKLFIPGLGADTLTFDVTAKADPGYSMNVVSFTHGWDNAPASEGWGYDADTKKLKVHTENMQGASPPKVPAFDYPQFTVEFIPLHYYLEFTIPEDMRDGDVFVANRKVVNGTDETYEVDWFTTQDYVTAASVKVPPLYNANGCRINWRPATGNGSLYAALPIEEELQYLTPSTIDNVVNNILVPDTDNPVCIQGLAQYNTIRVDIDATQGDLSVMQMLAIPTVTPGVFDSIKIEYKINSDANGKYFDVPQVFDEQSMPLGVKLKAVVVPKNGYIFNDIHYEMFSVGSVDGNLHNGDYVDARGYGEWNVHFVELKPVYVEYNLSVNSADLANVNLPVEAAPTGMLEINTYEDSVAFWMPYRTDNTCFMGWSNKAADLFSAATDSLYKVLSANNYHDFEFTDENSAKTLYAIWDDCSNLSAPPTPTLALTNGIEHATLALYQKFGNTKILHKVPSGATVSLAGDAFDFYVDENSSVADAGYILDNTLTKLAYTYVAGTETTSPVEVTKDATSGAYRVSTVQNVSELVTYTFTNTALPNEYTFIYDKNTDKAVAYGASAKGSETYKLTDASEELPLQTLDVMTRADACLAGWSLDADGSTMLEKFDFASLHTLNERVVAGQEVDKLYAIWTAAGTAACTPKTFTVTSDVDAERGVFNVYQMITTATGTNKVKFEVDPTEGVKIPFVENMELEVEFVPAPGYITMREITGVNAADANDVLFTLDHDGISPAVHGKTFTVAVNQPDVLLKPELSLDYLAVTFNENPPTATAKPFLGDSWGNVIASSWCRITEDNDGNWQVFDKYTINRRDEVFPKMYNSGYCFKGYTFAKNDNTAGVFTKFDNDFIIAHQNNGANDATQLYAYWEQCNTNDYTVGLLDKEKGSYKLVQFFRGQNFQGNNSPKEREYVIPAGEDLKLPSNADDISFRGINFTVNDGVDSIVITGNLTDYVFELVSGGTELKTATSIWSGGYALTSDVKSVRVPLFKNKYEFAYSRNIADTAKVFFGTPRRFSDTYEIDDATGSVALPLDIMARTDACLTGWTLEKSGGTTFDAFNESTLRILADYVEEGKPVDSLYAVWTAAEAGVCEPKTFMVTTNVSAAKGEFKVYQVVGNGPRDTLWYKVLPGTNGGVEIPTVDGMKLGVKFSGANGYTVGANVSVNDGSTTKTIANGKTFEVVDGQPNVLLDITTTAVTYHLAFNENDVGAAFFGDSWEDIIKATANSVSSDNDGNWIVKASYSLGGQTKFPTALYRADKCLYGYTFETGTTKYFKELNDEFIEEFNARHENPADNTTLYALWGDCDTAVTGETIKLANADEGTYTFTRKFAYGTANDDSTEARTYETTSDKFVIPSDKKDVSFTNVEFKVKDGKYYILNSQKKIAVKAKGDDAEWSDYTAGNLLTVKDNKVDSVKAPLLKSSYTFNYDRNFNDGKAVFYSPAMKLSETYKIANATQSQGLLPTTVMGRTDACMSGWTLDKDDPTAKIGEFNEDALRLINEREENGKDVSTLYAIWDNPGVNGCTPKTFTITTDVPASQGAFQVYQYVEGFHTAPVEYEVGNGIVIPTVVGMNLGIKFTGASTYSFGTEITVKDDVSGNEKNIDNEGSITVANEQNNLTLHMEGEPVKFFFAFNENAADFAVKPYFGDSWQNLIDASTFSEDLSNGNWSVKKDYTVESPMGFPMDLYSNTLCLQGYGFTENSYIAFTKLTDDVIAKYNEATPPNQYSSSNPMPLYAVWGACTAANSVTVNFADLDKGKYVFSRTFSKGNFTTPERVYEVTSANTANGFMIPSDNGDISFTDWKFVVNPNTSFIVDTDSSFAYRKNASSAWNKIAKGSLFTITDDVKNVNAPLLTNTYKFAYSVNADSVFFAPSAEMSDVTYSLADASDSENLKALDIMARANACLDGWSLDKAGKVKIDAFDVVALRKLDSLVKKGETVDSLYAVWNTRGCNQNTFTITTETPTSKGKFEVYQVIGSAPEDTLWYKVDPGNSGVEIPTIANMMLGVKFTEAIGYTFDSTVFADTGATVKINVDNGKTFKIKDGQKNVVLSVNADVVNYNLAFHENDDGAAYFGDSWEDLIKATTNSVSKDNNGNWIVKANYSLESQNKNFPMALYREGKCLNGYTFDTGSTKYYTELNDDFIKAFNNQGKNPAATTVLYALWGTCASTVAGDTITLVNADKGTYKFSRKFDLGTVDKDSTFARTYETSSEKFVVPSDNKDISFTNVEFTVNDGFGLILDTDRPIALRAAPDSAIWRGFSGHELLTVNTRIDSVKAPLLKNSYTFAYDKNFAKDSAVFYSPDVTFRETYTLADVSQSKDLQPTTVMGRADACLTGWALDTTGNNVIGAFDAEALRTINTLETRGNDVRTLYAVWTDKGKTDASGKVCTPTTFKVTTPMPAEQGSFKLYRLLDGDTTWYNVGTNGIEIPTFVGTKLGVKFTAASPAYTFGSDVIGYDDAGNKLFSSKNGKTFDVVDLQKNVALSVSSNAVEYTLAFNENASGEAFFGNVWDDYINGSSFSFDKKGNWIVTASYSVNSINKSFPMAMYRDGYCMTGYTFTATDNDVFTELDDDFIRKFAALGKTSPTTLYAHWDVCSKIGTSVKLADTDKGKYTFTRTFDLGNVLTPAKRTYEVATENFVIPSSYGDVSFDEVAFEVTASDVILDTDAKFSVKGTASTASWTDYTNGDMLTAGANLGSVKVPLLKNTYTFAYAKNYAVDSAVFYSPNMKNSGTYTIASVAESKSLQALNVMGRSDACLTGWALDKAGKVKLGSFDAEALRTLKAASATDTLYAVWTKKGAADAAGTVCKPTTFTVTSAMPTVQGSFKVYRLLGNDTTWYNVGTNGIEIPTLAGMKLGVKFTGFAAYTFGSNVLGSDAGGAELFSTKNGNTFTVATAQKNVKLSVDSKEVTYNFAFNANAGQNSVFNGTGLTTTIVKSFTYGDTLPLNLYRTDATLVGWSLKPLANANAGEVFTKVDSTFVNAYGSTTNADTLYAVWTLNSTRKTYTIAITNLVEEGSFELKNASSVYTVKTGEMLKIPAESDLTFSISFKPNSYNWNEYTSIEVLDAKSGKQLATVKAGDSYLFTTNVSLRAVGKFSPVQFALNTNAGTNKVFFGDAFKEFTWTAMSFEDELPTGIYRTDAELAGWSLDKNATKGSVTFDEKLAESYNTFRSNKSNANKTPVLYAIWQKKTVQTITVKADSATKGSLTLTQFVGDSAFAHAVSENGMKVPSVDNGLIFQAHFDINDSWSMNANKPLVWTTAKVKDSTANDAFKVVKTDVTVKVLAVFKEFHFVFDVSGDSLFYGDDWKMSGDFASTEDKNETSFPTMVYNTDSCLAGWSVKIGTNSYTNLQDTMISDLYAAYPNINSSMNVKLYAEWTNNVEDCAGNITRIGVEQQHGDVHLIENMAKTKLVHKFNKYGSMLLPAEIESDNWTVRTNPDSSFVLDSLVVERDGKKEAVLHEGDHLPKNMKEVKLYAYFGKANKTPIEILDTNFAQSGNAVRVGFRTSAFEVTRGVAARVRISDEKGAVVVDSLLSDSIASAFADEVIMRVHKPGTYKMLLTFSDRKESAEYDKQFTVNAQITSFAANRWHMISLAPVDTSAIVWNDNNHFYWWDDSYCGEYWQYKTFNRGDEIVGTRGVWYSSQDGTPLVIRNDIEDDGEDIVWELDSIGSGWNLVANPHGWRMDLFSLNPSARKSIDEKAEITFWHYNAENNDYEEVDTLEPYEAVWAKVSAKTLQWVVSAKPIFSISNAADTSKNGLSKRTLAKATTKDRWTLQAVLEDRNGHRDSWNILGVSNNPFVAEEPPTSFGDHVNLSIVEGKHGLAKSIKDADAEKEWTVALSATSSRTGYLSFVGIKDINAFGYHVYVTVDGTTTEMKEGTPLQVSLSSNPKNATVRVERGTIAVAQKSGLKSLRSAKLGNQLHVSFEVPDELVNESTRVELLSAKGGVVATASARSVFGTNKVLMDVPKNGVYILRVRVGSAQVTRQILVK